MVEDAGQVSGPVAVMVGEAPWVDLVDHAVAPIGGRGRRAGLVGHRDSLAERLGEGQTGRRGVWRRPLGRPPARGSAAPPAFRLRDVILPGSPSPTPLLSSGAIDR